MKTEALDLREMEFSSNGLSEIFSALTALVSGVYGGIRIGKSKQVEEIKELITQYKDANEFTKEEAAELRIGIKESRAHNEKCENDLRCVRRELDDLKKIVCDKL